MSAVPLVEQLTTVGEAIHGAEWQRRIAADLGAHHPRGARDKLDDRLVRRWVAGDRPVPAWVGDALPRVLASARLAAVDRMDGAAQRLGYVDAIKVAAEKQAPTRKAAKAC